MKAISAPSDNFYENNHRFSGNQSTSDELSNDNLVNYVFYSYFFPSEVDMKLVPFARHMALDGFLQKREEIEDSGLDFWELSKDIRQDRRIKAVENKSRCTIKMESLSKKFVKGLPMRKITISGDSNNCIAKCLTILQDIMPDLIRSAVFPHTLGNCHSTNWPISGKFVIRPILKSQNSFRPPKNLIKELDWEKRISKNRVFPNMFGKYKGQQNT